MTRSEYTDELKEVVVDFNIKLVAQEAAGLRDEMTTEKYAEGGGAFLGFLLEQGWTLTPPPVQPPIGGFCDQCGHLAARHNVDGCSGVSTECECVVMVWQGHRWPRPWLPAPEGLCAGNATEKAE